jgi:hypothetical protein
MSDDELEQIIGKARKFRALARAKARVERLERELRGEPAKPEDSTYVPEFLRARVGRGFVNPTHADVADLHDEEGFRARTTINS